MPEPDEIVDTRVARALHQYVFPALDGPVAPLASLEAHHVPGEPIPYAAASRAAYEPFAVGAPWGPAWSTTWFRLRGAIPAAWKGQEVALAFGIGRAGATGFGAEALVWDDGRPAQGLSPNHRTYRLTRAAAGGDPIELYVEAAANPRAPLGAKQWPLLDPEPDGPPLFTLARAELVVVQRELGEFAHDLRVLVELLASLDDDEPRGDRIRHLLNAACNELDLADVRATYRAAWPALREALDAPAAPRTHVVHAVGHAHLDTAWLWPLRETLRKCARTFATAVTLMDDHPEYHFVCSQAQQLAWTKQHYPDLYARIREKVATGQFEPTGSMWVEPDTNIPSGESLVRQVVHGKRFYLDEFGIETRDGWLPDVFGYSGALPQILRRAGVDRFLTQKLSWNQYNELPHDSFWWEGIDGSRVFTHFPPSDTYGGDCSVQQLRDGMLRFRDHAVADRSLYPFGWSDGGGGPTTQMLASLARCADLEGLPRVEIGGARAFFDAAIAESDELATWVGELYFECHRGTYTTQAATKLGNRRGEDGLRAAEMWSAAARSASDYPTDALGEAWRLLLVHQFHDIIPGSGIHWVYEDTARDHAEVLRCVGEIIDSSLGHLAAEVDTAASTDPVVVFNAAAHDRREWWTRPDGSSVLIDVPACGYTTVDVAQSVARAQPAPGAEATPDRIENEHLRVHFDVDGLITSIYDKRAEREVVAPDATANVFQLHPDYPNSFDAWDIDRFAFETVTEIRALAEVRVVDPGPVQAALRFVRRFGDSTITQEVSLTAGARRIEFATDVDWHESNRLLKVAFPVAVRAPEASYEIQFGFVRRPTHANTTWDEARFEVCAQRWADLSESGYGVALLNDCKYGYDVTGNVLRLSLLRAPSWPDPTADRGRHHFTYALLPHAGNHTDGRVVEEARELNTPLVAVSTPPGSGPRPARGSLVSVEGLPVDVTAVKRADRAAGVVVRLVEVHGARGRTRLSLWAPIATAARTDLLERDESPLAVDADGTVSIDVSPFEIVTVRAEPA
ncbi:MAG TPA: alpha-mannosidase [Acidimicrobiia bacterium]|nr:alpha-mannosidase [Acidimicrobiia bacterium]